MAHVIHDRAITDAEDRRRADSPLDWYADAFSTDRDWCWRYITRGGFRGIPRRCPGRINWAGLYDTRDRRRHRVWACDGHLTGGHTWIERPARGIQR